jgi:hypothetical protein
MRIAGIGNTGPTTRLLAAGLLLCGLVLVQALVLAGGQPLSSPLEGLPAAVSGSNDAAPVAGEPSRGEVLERLAAAEIGFVENAGQAHRSVSHLAQGPGYAFAFGRDGVQVSLAGKDGAQAGNGTAAALGLGLEFVGANPAAQAELAGRPTGGTVDYRVGEQARWRAGLASYPELVYRDLWPGIDMAFTGSGGKLKYEFRLAPGADPSRIQLAYQGAQSLSLASGGALQVKTEQGVIKDVAPISYQHVDGRRVPVESGFALGQAHGFGFTTGAYDHSRPLVIDPGLKYSTYLGGTALDSGLDVVVSGTDAYVAGATFSPDFPTTANGFDTSPNGSQDAFLAKVDTSKSGLASLEYSTVLGGGGPDAALSVEVKSGGDAYLTGFTGSPNFPVTASAYDPSPNGGGDAFLTRLDTTAGAGGLEYSTYLGGSQLEVGLGIDVVPGGRNHAFVTGTVMSPEFPTTLNAFDITFNGGGIDGFVTRIDTDTAGTAGLLYSTFLGGAGPDSGREIHLNDGDAYLAGPTGSPDFPVSAKAFDTSFNDGGLDAFVTRLDPRRETAGLEYSTFLGGSGQEDTFDRPGTSLAVVGTVAVVASVTTSPDFPVRGFAFDTSYNGGQDAFVTRINTARNGAAGLRYSTYLGGGGDDIGRGIAAASADDVVATGGTNSDDFPVTGNAFQDDLAGGQDAFVTRLVTSRRGAAALEYSTYLGGGANELGRGIAVRNGHAYVTGETFSDDFPVTGSGFDGSYGGEQDGFLSRLNTAPGP